MERYVVKVNNTLRQALSQMDRNKVKFLIAVDDDGQVAGTLTDGDVRRAVLKELGLDQSISFAIYREFVSVRNDAGLPEVLSAFKNPKIKFLPVIDEDRRLCNIITRRALNVLLLQNQRFEIDYDFSSIDENLLEHEIFSRPWGFYKTTVLNEFFQGKVLYIMPGQALSLQSHQHREEYWTIISGIGLLQMGDSVHPVMPGGTFFIPKGCKHRLTNTSEETLILNEVQMGDYFGEDDIQRYDDKYGRE